MPKSTNSNSNHWSKKSEKPGGLWQMRFVFRFYKLVGFKKVSLLLHPIVFFMFIFSSNTRKISRNFLEQVKIKTNDNSPVKLKNIYFHIYSFAFTLIEKLSAWVGDINSQQMNYHGDEYQDLLEHLNQKKGAVIICSHLGNTEMLRAFGSNEDTTTNAKMRIHSIIDTEVTSNFNSMINELNQDAYINLIQASSVNPATIIKLKDAVDQGDVVVIAGERTAANNIKRSFELDFLGKKANFPQGPYVLATLLDVPIYYMFAVRENDLDYSSPYKLFVYRSKVEVAKSRKERRESLVHLAREFRGYLEELTIKHPYQWFNFYDFWFKSKVEE